jgi:phosphatidylglycerol:prolipoprotein diacylglycerol transferase
MFAIPYPVFDPVAVEIGPVVVRWYALAYLFGLLLGWRYARWLSRLPPVRFAATEVDDFLTWATLGVVVGGRLGYVVIVQPEYFLDHPLDTLKLWKGGMAFHGGLFGVVVAGWIFASVRKLPKAAFADVIFAAAPIGLFLGRLANFVNNELVGRPTDVPWAMVFPGWGDVARHPSQLYEAALEGLVLLLILFLLSRSETARRRAGLRSGVFLVGYAVARTVAEQFREIDPHIGILGPGVTMGQVLSLPMLAIGGVLIARALIRPPEAIR